MIASGIVLGLAGSVVSGQGIKRLLYGTRPFSPGVLAVVCAIPAGAGLLAAYLPAHRAGTVDPMQALRSE